MTYRTGNLDLVNVRHHSESTCLHPQIQTHLATTKNSVTEQVDVATVV